MSDVFSQKSLQKMKQKLQSNMPKISVAELNAEKKSGLSKAIEAMSDEIIALKNQGLSYNQIASELEKVGLKTKGNTIRKYIYIKNKGGNQPVAAPVVKPVATPTIAPAPVVAAPSVTPEPAPAPVAPVAPVVEQATKVIIKPASTTPAQKHKAPVAGSKEFDELGFN